MRSQRFRRFERLLTPAQYKHVYAAGFPAKSPWFWIYRAANGLTYSRLGISVSNRVCVHLVARNRIKRIIREVFRLNKQKFTTGRDIVIVVKSYPSKPTLETVKTQILKMIGAA